MIKNIKKEQKDIKKKEDIKKIHRNQFDVFYK